jgi:serine kinase of HPr protein (carbohydrate metabolism regulator)
MKTKYSDETIEAIKKDLNTKMKYREIAEKHGVYLSFVQKVANRPLIDALKGYKIKPEPVIIGDTINTPIEKIEYLTEHRENVIKYAFEFPELMPQLKNYIEQLKIEIFNLHIQIN